MISLMSFLLCKKANSVYLIKGEAKMNELKVGFSKVNINPELGCDIAGYFIKRTAKGFLDDLEVRTLALECNGKRIAVISVDCLYIPTNICNTVAQKIEQETGIPSKNIFLTTTHSHTGPRLVVGKFLNEQDQMIVKYIDLLVSRISNSVLMAFNDLKPSKVAYITGYAPERVSYIRRYKMKDGTTMTCPPVDDPNIDHPIGELDLGVNVVRFDRENSNSIVIVNYGVHADTIGGEYISADFPHWLRLTISRALDGVECLFLPGAQGDVGSTNVHPRGGDMNDTLISFDNEMKSPGMARFVGRALAGTVLQVYDKACYIDVDDINIIQKTIKIPSNMPDPKYLPLAHKYCELHNAGRDDEIPFEAMELTTVIASASRMCRLENGPEYFEMDLTCLKIGNIVFAGIPGEPFTGIGTEIKKAKGCAMILPCALTNGYEGYFPMKSAYDEGGYEAGTSNFKAGVAELIIKESMSLIDDINKM